MRRSRKRQRRSHRAFRCGAAAAIMGLMLTTVAGGATIAAEAENTPIETENASESLQEYEIVITVEPLEIETLGEAPEETEPETEAPAEEETQAETEALFQATAVPTLSAADQQMLLKVAMAEAEDQGTKGKALVMCVVLNRVADRAWPNNVHDVIYQKGQFEVISNGRYNRVTPDAGCYEALEWVMSGWDESQGAEYFCMAGESRWHENHLRRLFQYKDHVFYK